LNPRRTNPTCYKKLALHCQSMLMLIRDKGRERKEKKRKGRREKEKVEQDVVFQRSCIVHSIMRNYISHLVVRKVYIYVCVCV
jgi:hypothetical protein